MAQPGGPKRDVPNVYPTKVRCVCDRPIVIAGVCLKCGHLDWSGGRRVMGAGVYDKRALPPDMHEELMD